MKWENKLALFSVLLFLLSFPATGAYLEVGVQIALDFWAEVRTSIITVPTAYLVGWTIYKYKSRTKLNIPKKAAKAKKAGAFIS